LPCTASEEALAAAPEEATLPRGGGGGGSGTVRRTVEVGGGDRLLSDSGGGVDGCFGTRGSVTGGGGVDGCFGKRGSVIGEAAMFSVESQNRSKEAHWSDTAGDEAFGEGGRLVFSDRDLDLERPRRIVF